MEPVTLTFDQPALSSSATYPVTLGMCLFVAVAVLLLAGIPAVLAAAARRGNRRWRRNSG